MPLRGALLNRALHVMWMGDLRSSSLKKQCVWPAVAFEAPSLVPVSHPTQPPLHMRLHAAFGSAYRRTQKAKAKEASKP